MRRCILLLLALSATACVHSKAAPASVPGMGDLMSAVQRQHAKLWFAGEAGNWPLAAYEMDELKEGFGAAVRLHPIHKGAAVAELLPSYIDPALEALDAAIAEQDPAAFERAFDSLTTSCNGCHQAAHFGFNRVVRPGSNPFTNQDFRPAAR